MEQFERIAELVLGHLRQELTEADAAELQQWTNASPSNLEFFQSMTNADTIGEALREFLASKERIYNKIRESLPAAKVISFRWKQWAAAAAILILGICCYFILTPKKEQQLTAITQDIEAPKNTRATITLADGRKIYVDSLSTLQQSNVHLVKAADGKIIYSGQSDELVYNTLSNPRGSKVIDVTLSDGTKVWLNSESSIHYPVSFNGDKREVEITGEAYFEVTKSNKKFIVTANGLTTEVLGTHFNINTYPDESSKNVTLLEGSIKVNNILIQPGQQAQVTQSTKVTGDVNSDAVMAWKNGNFDFAGSDIQTVMRQISRWYDVNVSYRGAVPVANFRGTISRSENVLQVLRMMEITGAVKFEVKDREIIVTK